MNQSETGSKNKPVHEVRFGAIYAAVWENPGKHGVMHTVTLSRSYKDGDEWKSSAVFGRDDLLVAAKALDHAHTWVFQNRS